MNTRDLRDALLAGACAIVMVSGGALAQQQQAPETQQPGAGAQQQATPGQATQQQAGEQGAPEGLSSEDVRQLQQRLSDAGHDITVDGIWGPETQSALREFQQEQGLEATGNPDLETRAALGVTTGGGQGEQMPTGGQAGAGGGAGQLGAGGGAGAGGGGQADQPAQPGQAQQ